MTDQAQKEDGRSTHVFNLAVVGCGQIATHHLEAIASQLEGKVALSALCDPSAERRYILANLAASQKLLSFKDTHTAPEEYESLDNMIADDATFSNIDILFIAVPHDLHESLALQALDTNKIVVLEKPLAPTISACNRLVSRSEQLLMSPESQGMLIIAEQSPYWESVILARELIAEGKIGRIVTGAAYYYESMRDNITSGSVDANGGLGWRGSIARAGGGIAIDGGLHWIRPLREMLGRFDEVVAVTRHGLATELGMEGESLAHAILKIEPPTDDDDDSSDIDNPLAQPKGSGCLVATYSCNMLATAPMAHDMCPYFRITGTKGELVIAGDGLSKGTPGAGRLRMYDEQHPNGVDMTPTDQIGGFFLGFSGLWSEVYRICVQKDNEKAHESVLRAADDVRTVMAMYKSAETGGWISTASVN